MVAFKDCRVKPDNDKAGVRLFLKAKDNGDKGRDFCDGVDRDSSYVNVDVLAVVQALFDDQRLGAFAALAHGFKK